MMIARLTFSAQTLAKKEEEELEQDFEQYMSEIAALGVL
jgi:hypothetical protein